MECCYSLKTLQKGKCEVTPPSAYFEEEAEMHECHEPGVNDGVTARQHDECGKVGKAGKEQVNLAVI